MLRRTTNAAFRETGDQAAVLAAPDASRDLAHRDNTKKTQ